MINTFSYFYAMINIQEKIKSTLQNKLPGSASHKKMLPPGRVLKAAPKEQNQIKKSSVLLLLFMDNNDLKVCLIKRPAHMKHHAGQIAFPGGRNENGETLEETALRETWEEIGIEPESVTILGTLSKFYVEVSHFEILPIVGWIDEKPSFKLNDAEVEKTILFPIELFKSPFQNVRMKTITGDLDVPCVKYNHEIIWGATAMILSEFTDILATIQD